jgi:cholesterol oxidase
MSSDNDSFDFDWLVIGSGFGGSVSALRLSEKGHSVGVLECGRRFADDELPKSTADLKRYFWRPALGMKGIFRLTTFRDVSVVSGCGVGGGSLALRLHHPARRGGRARHGRPGRRSGLCRRARRPCGGF